MSREAATGTIAIIGGDARERTIAALAAQTGRNVRIFGFPLPDIALPGVTVASSPVEAAHGSDALILPLPGMKGLSVFAPQSRDPITIDRSVLEALAPGARIICGHASAEFAALAGSFDLKLFEYEEDIAGRVTRAPAIAEGAVARIVLDTDATIHGARIAVLGFGVVAEHVAAALAALHGRITVFARSAEQRAAASAAGHAVEPLDGLAGKLDGFDVVVSVIPAPVLTAQVLERIPATCTVFDLASPPGSADHTAAVGLGKKVIWARGLGATSPVSVGRAQWSLIERLLHA
jgi:dipicolinate synthase subunit A